MLAKQRKVACSGVRNPAFALTTSREQARSYTGLAPINPAIATKQTKLNSARAKVNLPLPPGAVRSLLSRTSNQNHANAATV